MFTTKMIQTSQKGLQYWTQQLLKDESVLEWSAEICEKLQNFFHF